MRNKFRGYYDLTPEEFKTLWESCLFVCDANVLLDMFRFSSETRNAFFNVLKSIQSRLWIPYQIALEYHNNLYRVIDGQVAKCEEVISDLKNAQNKVQQRCDESRNHPYIEKKLYDEMSDFCGRFCAELEKERTELEGYVYDNPIKNDIVELYKEKVGKVLSEDVLQCIYKEGQDRYAKKIPPGYADAPNKSGNEKYGDLVIWKEMISIAKEKKMPIIFITSDAKEDWYRKYKKKIICPRAELMTEFFVETELQFYAYTSSAFLSHANEYLKRTKISESVIDEVSRIIDLSNESAIESVNVFPEIIDLESHNIAMEESM